MTSDLVVVLCTAPATAKGPKLGAHDLARALVEEGLCACVNVVPQVESYYRWQGAVEHGSELLLIAKTTLPYAQALQQRILTLHPYDVPEVLELPVAGGSPAYLAWLRGAVGGARADDA